MLLGTPYHQALFILQPKGVTTKFPLRAYIRTRSQYYPQSFFLGYPDKLGHVIVPRKIKLSFLRFVQVPKNVGPYGIQTHCLGHFHSGTPGLARYARIMHFAGYHLKWFSIKQENMITEGKRMLLTLCKHG